MTRAIKLFAVAELAFCIMIVLGFVEKVTWALATCTQGGAL